MRAPAITSAIAVIAFACSPYPSAIRADHARQFGCEQRWVRVEEDGERGYRAMGCGFQSEWTCADRRCRMVDHRAYAVDAP